MLSSQKPLRTIAVLLAGLMAGQQFARGQPAAPATASTEAGAMDAGDPEAFARAKESVRQDPQNYRGHVYVALAHLGLEQLDAAAEAAGRALALAPAAAKSQVLKLVETIRVRRELAAGDQAAAVALAEGQTAKAAKLYEAAWRATPQNAAPGLTAAELYTLRLNQPVNAARLLREMKAGVGGEAVVGVELLDRVPDRERVIAAHRWGARAVPRLRDRLVDVPLATPEWIEDASFDLDAHLEFVRLPAPGGERQLLDHAAAFAMAPFDRERPPWQAQVVEGLEGGRAAYILKLHHALSDGIGIVQLMSFMHSRSPEPGRRGTGTADTGPRDPEPSRTAVWRRASTAS